MINKITCIIAAIFVLASTAAVAQMPAYYPKDGFQRVGTLDSVQLDRQIIVINDIPYNLANNFTVHSQTSFSVPSSRLRIGGTIGFKTIGKGRLITNIWLLPKNYESPRRR